jgi:hypothetical protein
MVAAVGHVAHQLTEETLKDELENTFRYSFTKYHCGAPFRNRRRQKLQVRVLNPPILVFLRPALTRDFTSNDTHAPLVETAKVSLIGIRVDDVVKKRRGRASRLQWKESGQPSFVPIFKSPLIPLAFSPAALLSSLE